MLLIVSSKGDLASDYLILKLKEKDVPYVRFNSDDFPDTARIAIEYGSGDWTWSLEIRGRKYSGSDFSAVYLRHLMLGQSASVRPSDREFAEQEVAETLRSLWRVIPDALWLNHPRDVWLASNKVLQLVQASESGLPVPRSLVSNSLDAIESFAASVPKQRLVAKAVKHGFTELNGRTVLAGTQAFSPDALTAPGVARTIPLMIQARVDKRYDVRVVVVDDNVFPVRIHSDTSPDAVPDWRFQHIRGEDIEHEYFVLPSEIEDRCRQLPKHFNLRYASMDLIEDREGCFWFLELNPNGQWAWLEQIVGCPIRDAIIQALGFGAYLGRSAGESPRC